MMTAREFLTIFAETRRRSEEICAHLQTEDYGVQPVEYVSPPKWHLGHTSWFFEEFVLKPQMAGYKVFDSQFSYVFNSYYESVGKQVIRTDRGNLSRPTVSEILKYRQYITAALIDFLKSEVSQEVLEVVELGIHHEKQHQELLLTDIKYILGNNPIFPKYNDSLIENPTQHFDQEWIDVKEGVYEIGHNQKLEFCYDNELGHHKVYLNPYSISNKFVTNGEYLEFISSGG